MHFSENAGIVPFQGYILYHHAGPWSHSAVSLLLLNPGPAAYGEEWLCLATRACWENHIQRPKGLFCSHDFHHYRYIFPWDSSCLRSTSLEAEPEMRCVQVIYRVFSRRNHTGQRRGAKQEFGFILIQQGALEQQIAPVD